MFILMLEADPDISKLWAEFISEQPNEREGIPYYILISDIARECSRMLARGQNRRVAKILEVVERWLVEGDPYVKEAATVGFIEDLQNSNIHDGTEPSDFIQFLGPESLFWWRKVEKFWSHSEPIMDDR